MSGCWYLTSRIESCPDLVNVFPPKDGRGTSSLVRVLAAAPHRLRTSLSCLAVNTHGYSVTVEVELRQNKEHWSLPYSSYYLNCR